MNPNRVSGRPRALPLVLALAALVVLAAGVAEAARIDCPEGARCADTERDDTIRGEGANDLIGKAGDDELITEGGESFLLARAGNDKAWPRPAPPSLRVVPGTTRSKPIAASTASAAANGEGDDNDCGSGRNRVTFDRDLDFPINCEEQRRR